jgi:hypothetical protein
MDAEEECSICNNHMTSKNLGCFVCKKSICLSCCNNLKSRNSVLFKVKRQVFIKYDCPYCRHSNNKHIKLFDKNEIVDIFIDTLTQLSIIQFNDNVNNRVRIDLENKINNMCHDINILRKSNDLLLLTNKANLVTYDALLERYNKKICPAKN